MNEGACTEFIRKAGKKNQIHRMLLFFSCVEEHEVYLMRTSNVNPIGNQDELSTILKGSI